MKPRLLISVLISMSIAVLVVGCGNKGELYRIPDQISEDDLDVLDEALDEIDVQTLKSTELEKLDKLSDDELDKLKAKQPSN
ncbi:MAG: hypothetical protein AB8B79_20355 [Granulosicoccus sp.]